MTDSSSDGRSPFEELEYKQGRLSQPLQALAITQLAQLGSRADS
jgi:hypothetical protein